MELADKIKRYYFNNLEYLTPNKRFHFASRLAAWEGSARAEKVLGELKPFILPDTAASTLEDLSAQTLGTIYADSLRRTYFQKYEPLHGLNNMLFRTRHLKEIYGIDIRQDFLKIIDLDQLERFSRQLLNDRPAIKWLSSFAINHLYLHEKLYGESLKLEPEWFLDLYKDYELENPIQLNLLVYLFTHCIIADSNFYAQTIPSSRLKTYRQMLETLDRIIDKYPGVRLDAKLEYLVSSRICHKKAPLEAEIYRLVNRSIGSQGYIIEWLKSPDNHELNNINVAEHRNVLYIMSTTAYRPRKIRLVLD